MEGKNDVPDRRSRQQRILDAALHQVSSNGFDHVTVQGLTDEADVARGTLYSHFGDVPGVVASLWVDHGRQWLGDVARLGAPLHPHRDALAELLMVARRVPALYEVVHPDVEWFWASATDRGPIATATAVWLLAAELGTQLLGRWMPGVDDLAIVRDIIASLSTEVEAPSDSSRVAVSLNTPLTTDSAPPASLTAALTGAAMRVVAASGLHAATMMRVCRAARVTTGAAAPRFASLKDLHRFTFDQALEEVVSGNGDIAAQLAGVTPVAAQVAFARGALGPNRQLWRRYRQEMAIAARHDDDIAAMMRDSFARTNKSLRDTFVAAGLVESTVDLVVLFNVVYSQGLAAVDDLGIPLADVTHETVVQRLFDTIVAARG